DGADVVEAELLEEHAAGEEGLEALLDLAEGGVGHAADEGELADDLAEVALRALVKASKPGPVEALRQGADARADRHVGVIEDHEERSLEMGGVVEGLEDDAGRQGAVADDGDAMAVLGAELFVADLEAESGRGGAAGVTGHEQVEGALGRVGIAHE